jgi:hypothetical protein
MSLSVNWAVRRNALDENKPSAPLIEEDNIRQFAVGIDTDA